MVKCMKSTHGSGTLTHIVAQLYIGPLWFIVQVVLAWGNNWKANNFFSLGNVAVLKIP